MRHCAGSSSVHVIACRLFGAKPLAEPMMTYCQLDNWEQSSANFSLKLKYFHWQKLRLNMSSAEVAAILSWPQCVKTVVPPLLMHGGYQSCTKPSIYLDDLRKFGLHFTKGLRAHNLVKILVVLTWKILIWSVHNFAHVMTTDLLWYEQICDLVRSLESQFHPWKFSQDFN